MVAVMCCSIAHGVACSAALVCFAPLLALLQAGGVDGRALPELCYVRRVSGDPVVRVGRLGARASNCRRRLLLIDVPRRSFSSGLDRSVLASVPRAMEASRLFAPFLSAPLVGCTTNPEARFAFRFGLPKALCGPRPGARSLGCSAFGGMICSGVLSNVLPCFWNE